jgi:hypothetical protein
MKAETGTLPAAKNDTAQTSESGEATSPRRAILRAVSVVAARLRASRSEWT